MHISGKAGTRTMSNVFSFTAGTVHCVVFNRQHTYVHVKARSNGTASHSVSRSMKGSLSNLLHAWKCSCSCSVPVQFVLNTAWRCSSLKQSILGRLDVVIITKTVGAQHSKVSLVPVLVRSPQRMTASRARTGAIYLWFGLHQQYVKEKECLEKQFCFQSLGIKI